MKVLVNMSAYNVTSSRIEGDNSSYLLSVNVSSNASESDFTKFANWYEINAHLYVTSILCIFGILSNMANILVFTRKKMHSPVNTILTALAVADLALLLGLWIQVIFKWYLGYPSYVVHRSYSVVLFFLLLFYIFSTCYSYSAWLTVILAVWRFVALSFPLKSKRWCNMFSAKCAIIVVYVGCPLFCTPYYLSYTVVSRPKGNDTMYAVSRTRLFKLRFIQIFNEWVMEMFAYYVPCAILALLTIAIIILLQIAKCRQKSLMNAGQQGRSTYDRTSYMIIAILFVYMVAYIPRNILLLLVKGYGSEYYMDIYNNMRGILRALYIINSAINFVFYLRMSKQFKEIFLRLFLPKVKYLTTPVHSLLMKTTLVSRSSSTEQTIES